MIIGVAGGSGSGKTTFARKLCEYLGLDAALIIAQDSYYIDQSNKFDRDGGSVNFDHPESIDWELLHEQLQLLNQGLPVEVPQYDFATHKRASEPVVVQAKEHIIVDGILIYDNRPLIELIDYKIFIEAPEDIRFARRLHRDVVERGRTEQGVKDQFLAQVKPMHDLFVEPSRQFANQIISGTADILSSVDSVAKIIKNIK